MTSWPGSAAFPVSPSWAPTPVCPVVGAQSSPYPGAIHLPTPSDAVWQPYRSPYTWAPYAGASAITLACACALPGTWVRECTCGCKNIKSGPFSKVAQRWREHREYQNAITEAKRGRKQAEHRVATLQAKLVSPQVARNERKRWSLYYDIRDAQQQLCLRQADEHWLKEKKRG
jgi:hypothetical protein